jgi:hypothetical protein
MIEKEVVITTKEREVADLRGLPRRTGQFPGLK